MTTQYQQIRNLQVAPSLANFINDELLPQVNLDQEQFWSGFESLINDLTPANTALLAVRDDLQGKIDRWHREHRNQPFNLPQYKQFLTDIGYLLGDGDDFSVDPHNVDLEIASVPGPQLVVPVKNARFALNAANARWGSLYDALYGTDVIAEADGAERSGGYNPQRGQKVIAYARQVLDRACPLISNNQPISFDAITAIAVVNQQLVLSTGEKLATLAQPEQFEGFQGDAENPSSVLLAKNGLHLDIQIDPTSAIGSTDKAGISDVIVEAAVTTIADCEDSIAAVDAQDKVEVYRNWLGLIKGDLTDTFTKGGKQTSRCLNPDREYTSPDGGNFTLPGRSLLLVRNVGHLMRNNAIIDSHGDEIYEGILDAMITSAIGLLDTNGKNLLKNSRQGSVYIVKPKMHGPDEVSFTCELFRCVEEILGMKQHTLKVGIMDEERRTTVNLKECIRRAKDRIVFINTGFLDRTGDEIHTSMEAGPVVPKSEMKATAWIKAYEDHNVDVGLACGLSGKAQIGKGMWAMPDLMAAMVKEKGAHPLSGANTAWVPSPTAAVLHALHYHEIDVFARHDQLRLRPAANLNDILTIPILQEPEKLSDKQIQQELDNNAQGILGYVVRWIDQGIGCSKVPDIHNIGLMEDRATLRISSQHIANWLHHKLCTADQVEQTLQKMAAVVDQQNQHDPLYKPMAPGFNDSIAYQAACDLVFDGVNQPNGYTEPRLHARRLEAKNKHHTG